MSLLLGGPFGCAAGAAADDTMGTTGSAACFQGHCDLSAAIGASTPGKPGSASGGFSGSGGGKPVCVSVPRSEVVTTSDGHTGQWYLLDCGGTLPQGSLGNSPITGAPLWAEIAGGGTSAPAVDPAVLAAEAVSRLELPKPVVRMSPVETARQVVGVPSWLWVEQSSWKPVRSTAEVPGVVVEAVAVPVSSVWDLGDGSRPVECRGPGTPFRPGGDDSAASPDCGHVFARPSAGSEGGVFKAAVTTHWSVTWSGAGRGGTFPDLVARTELPVRVAEIQSLVKGGSGR
ncbi:hypothetical protein [Kitasatospora arboriphila]|uniref:hypothetical protein n=1 Tax=Kitasatospora arboriphila TaxID=258052 RepID=UPI0031D3C074